MNELLFLILGFIQGILEWLPVSSEGILVLVQINLFEGTDPKIAISVAFWLHIGTMIAVIIYYRKVWLTIIDFKDKTANPLRKFLILSTIGTGIVGIPVKLFLIDAAISGSLPYLLTILIGIALLLTGILIFKSKSMESLIDLNNMTNTQMIIAGMAQGVAILPGVSRSGITVSSLLFMKIKPTDSFKLSFLMSVPAVLGAIFLDLIDFALGNETGLIKFHFLDILIGITASFVMGILTLKYLIRLVETYNFGIITIVLGILLIIIGLIII